MMTREEHKLKELSLRLASTRNPRRSQTTQDYQVPGISSLDALTALLQQAMSLVQPLSQPEVLVEDAAPVETSRPTSPVLPSPPIKQAPKPRRPALGAPRRSYSVMDYEPVPPTQRPSTSNVTFQSLPSELHFAIFDCLDPIDSTCLGLTNRHLYDVHRRMHGSVPLSARRDGPNEMEWAWHLAGSVASVSTPTTTNTLGSVDGPNGLAALRVRGRGLCRKCGISRCELHKHIQEWMPEGHEYCTVREKWGPVAPEGAKGYCYLSSPKNPHRCGRHRVRKVVATPVAAVPVEGKS